MVVKVYCKMPSLDVAAPVRPLQLDAPKETTLLPINYHACLAQQGINALLITSTPPLFVLMARTKMRLERKLVSNAQLGKNACLCQEYQLIVATGRTVF